MRNEIDADALKDEIRHQTFKYNSGLDVFTTKRILKLIDNAPTVEYPFYQEAYQTGYEEGQNEKPQGEWIYNQYDGNANIGNWHCSECRHIVFGGYNQKPYYNFCSNCGAKMRGKEE